MTVYRYPSEFAVTPATDYLEIKRVRRDYSSPAPNQYIAGDSVFLNMPQRIVESVAQSWRNSSLGVEATKALTNNTGGQGAFAIEAARKMIELELLNYSVQQMGKLGASNLSDNSILSSTGGVIYNPMMEVLYDGPQFRQFQFQFILFAKSEVDAQRIHSIVRFFQKASVPSKGGNVNVGNLTVALASAATTSTISALGGGITGTLATVLGGGGAGGGTNPLTSLIPGLLGGAGAAAGGLATSGGLIFNGQNRFITQPPFLLLTFKRGSRQHPYILPSKPCVINNLQVDYTPSGNYTVLNNFGETDVATVVATNITIGLTEIKTVFESDYDSNGQYFSNVIY